MVVGYWVRLGVASSPGRARTEAMTRANGFSTGHCGIYIKKIKREFKLRMVKKGGESENDISEMKWRKRIEMKRNRVRIEGRVEGNGERECEKRESEGDIEERIEGGEIMRGVEKEKEVWEIA